MILGHIDLNQVKTKICLQNGNELKDIDSNPIHLCSQPAVPPQLWSNEGALPQQAGHGSIFQTVCVCVCFYDISGHF